MLETELLLVSMLRQLYFPLLLEMGRVKSLSSTAWTVGDYYQFSLSTVGYSGITLSYDQAGSNTGPGRFSLQYSTDGTSFTTVGGQNTILASTFTGTTNNAAFNFSYDLSTINGT
ncbi:MAG: hypothetical protein WDN00_03000 [Limisphaerales bacterium]